LDGDSQKGNECERPWFIHELFAVKDQNETNHRYGQPENQKINEVSRNGEIISDGPDGIQYQGHPQNNAMVLISCFIQLGFPIYMARYVIQNINFRGNIYKNSLTCILLEKGENLLANLL
jgi:hypothetical protein